MAREERTFQVVRSKCPGLRDFHVGCRRKDRYLESRRSTNQRVQGVRNYGQHFSKFYPEEDVLASKPQTLLNRAVEAGHVEDEGWRVRKDGSKFWANVTITAVKDDEGKLIGFGKVTRDLTERKRSNWPCIVAKNGHDCSWKRYRTMQFSC